MPYDLFVVVCSASPLWVSPVAWFSTAVLGCRFVPLTASVVRFGVFTRLFRLTDWIWRVEKGCACLFYCLCLPSGLN